MFVYDIIEKKRNKKELSKQEIVFFVSELVKGNIEDCLTSAFLMAIVLNGMTFNETLYLTEAMKNSSSVLQFDEFIVDKHSTGGVSDTTTLLLVPILAALGVKIGKMSGRSLGFTGGTIDKLEVFDGYDANKSLDEFNQIINQINCSIISQTNTLAYADKLLYNIRNKTATVDSIPLIASSIMSKKLASGARYLLLNVHYGSGAFMKTKREAVKLAKVMVRLGNASGVKTRALISYMGVPLSSGVGCTLEVKSALQNLKLLKNDNLMILSKRLAVVILSDVLSISTKLAYKKVEEVLENGSAVEKLKELIGAHGGNVDFVDDTEKIGKSKNIALLKSDKKGYVTHVDALKVAKVVNHLKELNKTEKTKSVVGVDVLVRANSYVYPGDDLAEIHFNDKAQIDALISELGLAFDISKHKHKQNKLIAKII